MCLTQTLLLVDDHTLRWVYVDTCLNSLPWVILGEIIVVFTIPNDVISIVKKIRS